MFELCFIFYSCRYCSTKKWFKHEQNFLLCKIWHFNLCNVFRIICENIYSLYLQGHVCMNMFEYENNTIQLGMGINSFYIGVGDSA